MSKIRSKATGPELAVRRYIYEVGFRGYRLNYVKIPGRPDICFTKLKVAIFINGCFWHRCPYCKLSLPDHNKIFWKEKFDANKERDIKKRRILRKDGWKVITIWECRIKKSDAWKEKLFKHLQTIQRK